MSYHLIEKEKNGKEIYPCDFRNKKVFLPFNELPFEGDSTSRFYMAPAGVPCRRQHWCYFGQIESLRARSPCLMLAVEDMYTGQWEIPVILTFPEDQIDVESLRPGHTIAILYPERSFCLGENVVVRVRDPAKIKVFPCDLDTLLQINEVMEEQTSLDDYVRCANCGKKENRDAPSPPRCSGCFGISYCGVNDHWNTMHKDECKIFKDLDWFKTLDWGSYAEETTFDRPHRTQIVSTEDAEQRGTYFFDPAWCNAEPVYIRPLKPSFSIHSGEMLWGQLPCIVNGMKNAERDNPDDLSASERGRQDSSDGWMYRVAARPGVWKIAKVHVRDRPHTQSGWIAYHESQDPLSLVERSRYVGYNSKSPSVSFVNRYDWGYHMPDLGNIPRTWADIDPDSGWKALLEREHRRKRVHKVICSSPLEDLGANHPDAARAKRREYYQSNKIFLLDADKAPGLVKFLARPSIMDDASWDRLPDGTWKKPLSYSLFSGERGMNSESCFGCNLHIPLTGSDWDYGRLIFSDELSTRFPGDREMIAFWYDVDMYGEYDEDEPACEPL
ncbi:uncharacterized protein ARMOST_04896 [Armillaria ostoyae]|uniref:MYND-type domain-containing protein n=1 Tax=Armillaria ostoyae TaxID=47428 RepID=A0A284QYM3_ARMOS|nr:uncharacterized protein ARMOST_04896 [Armillaria ostoyae]